MSCRVFQFDFSDFLEILETMLGKLQNMKQEEKESYQQFIDRQANTRSICSLMTHLLEKWRMEPIEEVICIKITKAENFLASGSICFHSKN